MARVCTMTPVFFLGGQSIFIFKINLLYLITQTYIIIETERKIHIHTYIQCPPQPSITI